MGFPHLDVQKYCFFLKKHSHIVKTYSQIVKKCAFDYISVCPEAPFDFCLSTFDYIFWCRYWRGVMPVSSLKTR